MTNKPNVKKQLKSGPKTKNSGALKPQKPKPKPKSNEEIEASSTSPLRTSFNTKFFKDQIKRAGFKSGREFATSVQLHRASLTHLFAGRQKFRLAWVSLWAKALNLTLEEVLRNSGLLDDELRFENLSQTSANTAPIKGYIDPEFSVHWGSPIGPSVALNPIVGSEKVCALRCQTSGSALDPLDGALFFYSDTINGFDPEAVGRLCLVEVNGEFLIRVVKRGYEVGRHNLSLLNGVLKEEGVFLKYANPILLMKFY